MTVKKKEEHHKHSIFTIGHSTRSIEEFIELLKEHEIKELIDIRTIPKSRHNPQYNGDALAHELRDHHICYRHMKGLGGLRHAQKGSINTGWHNASFRGFADYMQTDEFQEALEQLIDIALKKPTVIMCAEAVPWRCHRSLIGDALLVHGFDVHDIIGHGSCRPHALTSFAKVRRNKITYPG